MSLALRYASVAGASTVDGPGVRTVIWFQGCSIHCADCQNKALWDKWSGQVANPMEMASTLVRANELEAGGSHLYTVTGGEPFDQQEELQELVLALRLLDGQAHIIVYTGYRFGALVRRNRPGYRNRRATLCLIDVLVDGPYIRRCDNPHVQYVGSTNQRVIDIPATVFAAGTKQILDRVYVQDDIVTLDWSTTGMFTVVDGCITAAKGWIDDAGLDNAGTTGNVPKCGAQRRKGVNGNGGNG